ncbi:MAG: glycosyltransferase family 2 protein [bacterium]
MRNWTIGLAAVIVFLAGSLVYGFCQHNVDFCQGAMIFFTLYGVFLVLGAIFFSHRRIMKNYFYRPFVSILIPARNEECVIEATVRSLCALKYRKNNRPHFEIIVLDDNSTDNTCAILCSLEKEIDNLRVVRREPPRAGNGKSDVLNEGISHATGEVIAVFDADSRVHPDFLKNAVAYLYDPKVGGVQGRVQIYNAAGSRLAAIQSDEFSIFNHLSQITKDIIGGVTALGGNGQLTKKTALEAVGGWNIFSTTEDFDLTMRFLLKGWKVRYAPDAVLWQEGVENLWFLLRQRIRWAEGFLKCFFDYTLPLLLSRVSLVQKTDGLLSLVRVILPLWILVGYIFGVGAFLGVTDFYSEIHPLIMIGISLLLFGSMWLAIRNESRDAFWAMQARVLYYWFYNLIWVAAVSGALFRCLKNVNRVEWDKTIHKGSREHPVIITSAPQRLPVSDLQEQLTKI